MSLQETLNQMKAEFEAQAPADALAVMHRATEDLENSGLVSRALSTGDQAPEFTLTDHTGAGVASSDLLAKGPLVVSFYRGVW